MTSDGEGRRRKPGRRGKPPPTPPTAGSQLTVFDDEAEAEAKVGPDALHRPVSARISSNGMNFWTGTQFSASGVKGRGEEGDGITSPGTEVPEVSSGGTFELEKPSKRQGEASIVETVRCATRRSGSG